MGGDDELPGAGSRKILHVAIVCPAIRPSSSFAVRRAGCPPPLRRADRLVLPPPGPDQQTTARQERGTQVGRRSGDRAGSGWSHGPSVPPAAQRPWCGSV